MIHIDRYVIETLMPDLVGHDRRPSACLVYLFLWWATSGSGESAELSLRQIAEGIGISKRAAQDALAHLARRDLVRIERDGITAVARYSIRSPWRERQGRVDER